jgi:hypothetical protein
MMRINSYQERAGRRNPHRDRVSRAAPSPLDPSALLLDARGRVFAEIADNARQLFAPIRVRQIVRTLLLVGFALCPAVARAADVDLLLVLAADVSRSMDAAKFQLQRDGYVAAVADPRVLETIRAGRNGRIGLIFVEWSGIGAQRVVIDWMTVGDAASAKDFGDRLLESPRSFADRTSISGAIEFAMAQLARAPFNAPRQTIDISGDGTNNSGRNVVELRDQAVAKGITINGLVILSEIPLPWNPEHTNPPGGLDHY